MLACFLCERSEIGEVDLRIRKEPSKGSKVIIALLGRAAIENSSSLTACLELSVFDGANFNTSGHCGSSEPNVFSFFGLIEKHVFILI